MTLTIPTNRSTFSTTEPVLICRLDGMTVRDSAGRAAQDDMPDPQPHLFVRLHHWVALRFTWVLLALLAVEGFLLISEQSNWFGLHDDEYHALAIGLVVVITFFWIVARCAFRNRRFQYSLRTLFLLTLLVSIGMSWISMKMQQARRQKQAVEAILRSGGWVFYDYEADEFGDFPQHPGSPGPKWLTKLVGRDFFACVVNVSFSTDKGLEYLCELPEVRRVSLSNTGVTDGELRHLEGLVHLRQLYLCNLTVTDAGLTHLKGLARLETLYLVRTAVTDEGLQYLSGLRQLKLLHLEGSNKVTPDGAEKLQKALPNCIIRWARW